MIVFIVICAITLGLMVTMLTSVFWGWRCVVPFRTLRHVRPIIAEIRCSAQAEPLANFVEREHQGDAVAIFHHCHQAVDDFLGDAARRGIQQFVTLLIIIFVMLLVLRSGSSESATDEHQLAMLGVALGATDVVAGILFLQEVVFMAHQTRRYRSYINTLLEQHAAKHSDEPTEVNEDPA